jgi:hypothetical protein
LCPFGKHALSLRKPTLGTVIEVRE